MEEDQFPIGNTILIFNTMGKITYRLDAIGTNNLINISNSPKGIYLVKIGNVVKKIMKK